MKRSRLLCGPAIAVLLGLAGCGVVTVDVDVYKGPLANHVDVQREQAAITAMAAKPLLGKLRYQLEYYARYRFFGEQPEDHKALDRLRDSSDYIPTTWPTESEVTLTHRIESRTHSVKDADIRVPSEQRPDPIFFESSQAAFVNQLLAEYDSPEEVALLRSIQAHRVTAAESEIDMPGLQAAARQASAVNSRWAKARGRSEPGLETLTFFYLVRKQQVDEKSTPPGEIPTNRYFAEEGELFDALIHFAHRVVFAANNDVLFKQGLGIPKYIQADLGAIFKGSPDPRATVQSYVRVLQAVGNSILVNLDELRQQAQHDQDLRHATGREVSAALTAASPDPWTALHTLLTNLQAELSATQAQLAALIASTQPADLKPTPRVDAVLSKPNSIVRTPADTTAPASEPATSPATAPSAAPAPATVVPTTQPMPPIDQQKKTLEERRQYLIDVIQTIKDEIGGPLSESAASTQPVSGSAVVDRLIGILIQKRAELHVAEKNAKSASALDNAIAELQKVQAPFHPEAAIGGATDAKAVLDGIIAVLRQELIQAVSAEGADSEHVKHLKDAITTAEGQRQDMIYIRPASSYLRTSFPATSLQRDARIGFHNLLAEHMAHQIPFADLFANGRDYRTLLELDKQYWQNINTVRVVGGGNLNYVVAKDDVGNWYVKDYSADPKDIIKSAQGLALFAAGPSLKVGSDLFQAAANQAAAAKIATGKVSEAEDAKSVVINANDAAKTSTGSTGGTTTGTTGSGGTNVPSGGNDTGGGATSPAAGGAQAPSGANTSVLAAELKTSGDTYNQKTEADLKTVQNDLTTLAKAIQTAWDADPVVKAYSDLDGLHQTLTDIANLYLTLPSTPSTGANPPPAGPAPAGSAATGTAAKNAPPPSNTPPTGQQIIDDLQVMRRFHNALMSAVREKVLVAPAKLTPDGQKVVDQANELARSIVRDTIEKTSKKRQQTVNDYQVVLDLIGKSAGQ